MQSGSLIYPHGGMFMSESDGECLQGQGQQCHILKDKEPSASKTGRNIKLRRHADKTAITYEFKSYKSSVNTMRKSA